MLEVVKIIAKNAGEILKSKYLQTAEILKSENNNPTDLVSAADLESEKVIINALQSSFPEHNIFSEEAGMKEVGSEFTWYIDPLDGTSNFLRGIPTFGISIGLVRGEDAILGVLYFPMLDLMVYAEKGGGAFANGQKITVSNRPLEKSLYFGIGYYNGMFNTDMNVVEKVFMVKVLDQSSYSLAKIATGDAEIYIYKNCLHDIAAAACIIPEAGGLVTDYEGRPWKPSASGFIATNGKVHDQVLKLNQLQPCTLIG